VKGEPIGGGEGVQCCKALQVVMPDGSKVVDGMPNLVVVAVLDWVWVLEKPATEPIVLRQDTGPSRVASFSELVLQRSLRSHAPPVVA